MNAILQELVHVGLYKRTQGRVTRQVTFGVVALAVVVGAYELSLSLMNLAPALRYGIPALVVGVLCWAAYRLVNYPPFADFLIAVEAEMNKVSWPTRAELIRASLVVLLLIFFLAMLLYGYDIVWQWVLRAVGVVRVGGGQ